MRILFLAWLDSNSRRWFPIGQLTEDSAGHYQFRYVRGVEAARKESGFRPLPSFPDLNKVYESSELFPLFINRVMPRTRPDYPNYARWLGLNGNEKDPLSYLEHSGGRKATDTLEVFSAAVKRDDGAFQFDFFVGDLRHMAPGSDSRAANLEHGERLFLMLDIQNPMSADAIALRTFIEKPGDAYLLGYCPRYLSSAIHQELKCNPDSCYAEVIHVNPPPAPVQLRALCRMTFRPKSGISPFATDAFEPLAIAG